MLLPMYNTENDVFNRILSQGLRNPLRVDDNNALLTFKPRIVLCRDPTSDVLIKRMKAAYTPVGEMERRSYKIFAFMFVVFVRRISSV